MKKITYVFIAIALLTGITTSCNKEALDPTLAQSKEATPESITKIEDVKGLVYGAYNRMTGSGYYGRDFIIWGEVRSDNCFSNGSSGRFVADARMDYTDSFGGHWAEAYQVIAVANIIIGLDPEAIDGDLAEIEHIIGQAYAIRALAHYDLLIYYGQMHVGGTLGVPYIKEYKSTNFTPERDTWANNVIDIYDDIEMAISLMDPAEDDSSKELFTYYGAQALKARVAIYFGDWSVASSACDVIINSNLYDIVPEESFVASWYTDAAVNSIFELAFSSTDNANINGLSYIYRGGSYGDVEGLQNLYDTFDAGDVRASADMIGDDPAWPPGTRPYCNLGKYPSIDYSDNVSVLRYEEVLLNKAEALFRINGGGDATALGLLNDIAAERGAAVITGPITEDMILAERRKELCFEGLRFHDFMRTGRDVPDPEPLKITHGVQPYGDEDLAFPIPLSEMDANAAMIQNPGY